MLNLFFILFTIRIMRIGSVRPSGQMHWVTGCKWNSSVSMCVCEAHLMVCNNWDKGVNPRRVSLVSREERVWWHFPSANHTAENTICGCIPESLG